MTSKFLANNSDPDVAFQCLKLAISQTKTLISSSLLLHSFIASYVYAAFQLNLGMVSII